jgi:hypothetical protein
MAKGSGKRGVERPAKWGQAQRLEFIEFRLYWEGRLNRRDLIDFFGISTPQASLDLARYMELAPENIAYNKTLKAYLPARRFRPVVSSPEAGAYLDILLAPDRPLPNFVGWVPPLGFLKVPNRQVKSPVLRPVLQAIREGAKLRIDYQSMSRPAATERAISPHALAFDGLRWHARAYCYEHKTFRDFVLARILKIHGSEPSEIDPQADQTWHRMVDVVLAPHPDLSAAQRKAVALDYGMKEERLVLKTRRALAFYVLRQLGLEEDAGDPRSHHIVLLNRDEIRAATKEGA